MSQNQERQNIFFSEYVLKKVEKISNALYIITSFFPDEEPLRLEIRKKTLLILSDISILRTKRGGKDVKVVAHISDHIGELMTLLTVARSANLVSPMNFDILEQELTKLASLGSGNTGPIFDNGYFDSGLLPQAEPTSQSSISSQHQSVPKQKLVKHTPPVVSSSTPKKKEKRARREQIIDLLKQASDLTIKDISKHISGVSNKTIQRELGTLVDKGIVKKEGERRWTRYSLV